MKPAEFIAQYPQFKAFIEAQRGPLCQALAVQACQDGTEPQIPHADGDGILTPCELAHGPFYLPASVVFAACETAGILDDVLAALHLSIQQSNGCVSILESGRLLASIPLSKWQELIAEEFPCPTTSPESA